MILTRPEWVLSAPLVAALLTIALLAQRRRLQRLARSYTDEATRRLVPLDPGRFPTIRMACLLLASLAIGLAAAGPAPVAREPAEPPAPLDLAIAVDVSLSMTAPDVEPTRLGRAREIGAAVSEAIPSARVTLVVFADWPYTLVPPTDDPAVVQHFARSLAPDVVLERDQGTSLAGALLTARRALDARPRSRARRVVLVLSDGGAHDGIA
ncbi:MAG TPA: VWA domain-containing protein, partial [Longimicrobiales bacterium]|nr:VWA domain-containing protein [Longimicrobiales bacterium]